MPRYAARVDDNQAEIVASLREILGRRRVIVTSRVGAGFPDIIVLSEYRDPRGDRVPVLIELKDGEKPQSKQSLTPAEVRWHDDWTDAGGAVFVCNSLEQCLQAIGWRGGT